MPFIKYDAEGVEVIQPGEEDLKAHVAGQFNQLQKLSFTKTAHCMRATHLKTQGVSPPTSILAQTYHSC